MVDQSQSDRDNEIGGCRIHYLSQQSRRGMDQDIKIIPEWQHSRNGCVVCETCLSMNNYKESVTIGQTYRWIDRHTDAGQSDPICCYAKQAKLKKQKEIIFRYPSPENSEFGANTRIKTTEWGCNFH